MKKTRYYFNLEREDGGFYTELYFDRKTMIDIIVRYLLTTKRGYYLDTETRETEKERIINYYITKNGRSGA